jgi:hypothetical protein
MKTTLKSKIPAASNEARGCRVSSVLSTRLLTELPLLREGLAKRIDGQVF